jgi:hypothetical protein
VGDHGIHSRGLAAFGDAFPRARKLLVGGDRIAVEEFSRGRWSIG